MPAEFDMCVRNGGKVRTKKLSGGRYMRVCMMNGKSHAGEIKMKKKMSTMMGKKKKGKKKKARKSRKY